MKNNIINISICEAKTSAPIHSALEGLSTSGYNFIYRFENLPDIIIDDIIIIKCMSVDLPAVKYILSNSVDKNKVVFVIPENDSLLVSSLIKLGFNNFFVFPYEYYLFIDCLKELLEYTNPLASSSEKGETDSFDSIIGESKEMKRVIEVSRKISDKENINILITGETGTGKGMLARAIHEYSNSGNNPFVEITCTSIPESLLESELFGYEAGAFTNAKVQKQGLFELAENGTLFLDEIGDISMNIQSKLLRTLDKKIIRRLGSLADIPINARIISATNANIEENVANSIFRRDLFHRLNTVSIELPALRERENDAELIAGYFIRHYSSTHNKRFKKIDESFTDYIRKYNWPGNIRELRNFVERNVLLSDENILYLKQVSHSSMPVKEENFIRSNDPSVIHMNLNYEHTDLKMIEKLYAKEILNKFRGNKTRTAKSLGISRPKLDDLLNN